MRINKSYLFEVIASIAPSAGVKYNFPNNLGELNNVIVKGLEIYSASQLIKSPLTYASVVAQAGLLSGVLVLVEGTSERIRQIPLIDLVPQLNGGLQREFEPFTININKSYIQLVAATNVNLNEAFCVNLLYDSK
jgi:hypothetical protein